MQHTNPFLNKSTDTDWQILGELELPVGSERAEMITSWLKEILGPLKLQADFINRVLKSAQAAEMRARQSGVTALETGHIHLIVFAPLDQKSDGKTWGFFRIERLENAQDDKNLPAHSIEFFLYIEGK